VWTEGDMGLTSFFGHAADVLLGDALIEEKCGFEDGVKYFHGSIIARVVRKLAAE